MSAEIIPLPPLKDLASSDPTLRHKTLQTLLTHVSTLPASTPLTQLQTLQIWTPLFHALYLHDAPTTSTTSTQTLIHTLTTTLLSRTIPASNPRLKVALTTGFWETICREWSGIDRHRIDKFLSLVRSMVRAGLAIVVSATRDDDEEEEEEEEEEEVRVMREEEMQAARGQVEAWKKWPLSAGRGNEGRKVPDGIRYHVLDIWLDELEVVFRDEEGEDEEEAEDEEVLQGRRRRGRRRRERVLDLVMGLVEALATDALTKGIRLRAKEVLADERLLLWRR